MNDHPRKAVVLLSGGLDSATTLSLARAQGYACYARSLDYGQRHHAELAAARRVAHERIARGEERGGRPAGRRAWAGFCAGRVVG